MLKKMIFWFIKLVFNIRYRILDNDIKNKINKNEANLLLCNNTSWIDTIVIMMLLENVIFVFPEDVSQNKKVRFFMKIFDMKLFNSNDEESYKNIAQLLNNKKTLCMFPEEAITYSGQMGYFFNNYKKILNETDKSVNIYPVFIKGLFGSLYSRASDRIKRNKNRITRKRNIHVCCGNALTKENSSPSIVKQRISEMSVLAWDGFLNEFKTIPEEFIRTAKNNSKRKAIVDSLGVNLNFKQALITIIAFSKLIIKRKEENIGLLLPTTGYGAIVNMAVLMAGKNVVNLNYTAPVSSLKVAVKKSEIKTLYTSSNFIEKLEKRGIQLNELFEGIDVIMLEKEKNKISIFNKIEALLAVNFLPVKTLQKIYCPEKDTNKIATILFSSGSEGEPKGVMLTHKNILTNAKQISDAINIRDKDVVMACLPLFHAFGFTVTTIWPMLEGIKMVCHPDPKDVEAISKMIYLEKVTTLCSTNSFLNLFIENKNVEPLMLEPLKFIVAGAEKVKESTRNNFKLKFNKIVYEGYGATETGPCASVNIPDKLNVNNWKPQLTQKKGTVGMALPGGAFKIISPETKEELLVGEEGMVLVAGNQIMKGYLKNDEKTDASIINEKESNLRWYVTGDKGKIDEDGFLTIVDRYSRFAKIKGEMISLTALEQEILNILKRENVNVLAVNMPHEKNGEQIVLLFEGEITEDELFELIDDSNISYISRPKKYIKVDEIPLLGTGKVDFKTAKSQVEDILNK